MIIRHAQRSDLPFIAAIQAESWKDAYSDVLPQEYLDHQITTDLKRHWSEVRIQSDNVIMVAEGKGVVGFIAIWCQPDPFIDNLHVKPAERSKKIGSALMKSAALQLIQKGYKTAYLWAVESNERAIQFYERLGGVRTARALKRLFGHNVPNIKIVWSDISILCKNE